MKTNREFKCDDVNCMFKYQRKGDHRCRLNNNIAKQIFDEYGHTTCEIGLRQVEYTAKGVREAILTTHQMIREERGDGNL